MKNPTRQGSQEALPSPPVAVSPQIYAMDAVQRFLFSPDRNPNVAELVGAPQQMPPLPEVYGVLAFDAHPTIILGTNSVAQRAYHAGDQAGAFKLVRFDARHVVFNWNGKEVERPLQELTGSANEPNPPTPLVASSAVLSDAAGTPRSPKISSAAHTPMGPALSSVERACIDGDQVAAGTISNGFTKVITKTPFGNICRWSK